MPRRLAMLIITVKSHVRNDERPSKASIPLEQRNPGLLHDLLGDRTVGHVAARNAQHRRGGVEIHQCGESCLVTGPQCRDEHGLVGCRAGH